MSNSLLLIEPNEFILSQAKAEKELEMQKALEIFLVTRIAKLNYEDLMDELPDGTASKNRFISWLNDKVRNNEVIREGIISSYAKHKPEHFENGYWNILYFHHFIQYVFNALQDPTIITDKKALQLFTESLKNDEWKYKAMLVASLKMLEQLNKAGKLKSMVATNILNAIFRQREARSENAKIIHRAVNYAIRNGLNAYEILDNLKENMNRAIEYQTNKLLVDLKEIDSLNEKSEEYRIYAKYDPIIKNTLEHILNDVTPKMLEYRKPTLLQN